VVDEVTLSPDSERYAALIKTGNRGSLLLEPLSQLRAPLDSVIQPSERPDRAAASSASSA
jgi:hypothetical protein